MLLFTTKYFAAILLLKPEIKLFYGPALCVLYTVTSKACKSNHNQRLSIENIRFTRKFKNEASYSSIGRFAGPGTLLQNYFRKALANLVVRFLPEQHQVSISQSNFQGLQRRYWFRVDWTYCKQVQSTCSKFHKKSIHRLIWQRWNRTARDSLSGFVNRVKPIDWTWLFKAKGYYSDDVHALWFDFCWRTVQLTLWSFLPVRTTPRRRLCSGFSSITSFVAR